MKLRKLFYIILLLSFSLPTFAVSDKDMENAKVIAAKLYLRWTNNASGYLDEINPTSMADLESKLKTAEIENLKAFKSVAIPADYATWDKERFVQFWGTTFFTSPALSDDGKRAKDRVKAKVKTLNVAPPSAAPTPAQETPAAAETNPVGNENPGEEGISIPDPQEVLHEQEAVADSMAVLQAEEQSAALAERPEKAKSLTWLYVVILIVLVILVVWLMVYAANMMKKQGKENGGAGADNSELKKEIKALETANSRLRDENAKLKADLEAAKAEVIRARAAANRKPEPKAAAQETAPAAVRPKKEEPKPQPKVITEIFLGRANPKGLFVRGDRRPNPDHTVFRLDTKDGIVGTFRFLETPETFALATSNPLHFLAGGCICDNFEDAETATRIVTENPGTAILENGCWKVLRKSRIRFE